MSELASLSLERNRGMALAEVSGELDLSNAEELRNRIARWVINEDVALILDFTEVSYADSAGINLVFNLSALLREHGQGLCLILAADSQPRRTFAIVGADEQFPIFETAAEAEAWAVGWPASSPVHEGDPSGER
jgi:anti-sigma B factor antagonist